MLDIVIWILTAVDIIVALLLIPLILVQKTKDGGFGSSFGGMGESVFGAHAASHLTKLTVILAATFLIVTLSLTVISGHRGGPKKGIAENNPELFVSPPSEDKAGTGNNVTPGTTTTQKPETDKNAESSETLPDGTVIKKVPGGTIKMTPVKKPEGATAPPAGENKVVPGENPLPQPKPAEEKKQENPLPAEGK